jgi:putative protein-disulfide isomerase
MKIRINTILALLLVFTGSCNIQTNNKMKDTNQNNPLLCNPESGICEMPGVTGQGGSVELTKDKPVQITYFTDPICSSCWGIEPQLRKLKLEYGDAIHIDYRMGGLLPSWNGFNGGGIAKPSDVAHHWDEVSLYYEMPIDGDVWLEDPLNSSYPPSIAFKAAQLQDEQKAVLFLRRIREMVFLEKKNITKWQYLQQAGEQAGLDVKQLKADYDGKAKQLFEDDLNYARKLGVRGFPTLFFSDRSNNKITINGSRPYDVFESAILQLEPAIAKHQIDTHWESLFSHYPTLTTKEFSVLSGSTTREGFKKLQMLSGAGEVKVRKTKNGELWVRD